MCFTASVTGKPPPALCSPCPLLSLFPSPVLSPAHPEPARGQAKGSSSVAVCQCCQTWLGLCRAPCNPPKPGLSGSCHAGVAADGFPAASFPGRSCLELCVRVLGVQNGLGALAAETNHQE